MISVNQTFATHLITPSQLQIQHQKYFIDQIFEVKFILKYVSGNVDHLSWAQDLNKVKIQNDKNALVLSSEDLPFIM